MGKMLERVTITGADDSTDIAPLIDISRPYVRTIWSADGQSKTCSSCGAMKLLSEFPKHGDSWHYYCKLCHSNRNSKITAVVKMEVFTHYCDGKSPRCACCGEARLTFLTIDHIENDGAAHRRSGVASGSSMWYWLRRNGYPSGFQVLCWNCQHGKEVYGVCPHEAAELSWRC